MIFISARNSAIFVVILLLCSCASNPDIKSNDYYIVTKDRNDIKEKHPELWKKMVAESKENEKRSQEEINSVDYQFELNRAVLDIKTPKGQEKIRKVSGLWRNCTVERYKDDISDESWKTRGKGRLIEFMGDSKFKIYNHYYSSLNCEGKPLFFDSLNCGGESYSSNEILRFEGHYYIGNLMKSKEGVDVYEINMVHQDMPCSKTYNEERVYFTIVEIKNEYINFGNRAERSRQRTPLHRPKSLDKEKFRYYKVIQE
jgi:hypothetical protein